MTSSDTSAGWSANDGPRPRPVLWFAALIAGLNAMAAAGDLLNVLPPAAVTYVALASVVLSAVGAVIVQGAVTPMSDPRNAAGERLLPVSVIAPAVRSAARAGATAGAASVLSDPGIGIVATPATVERIQDAADAAGGPRLDPHPTHRIDDDWPGNL